MPVCPTCRETYSSDVAACPRDGTALVPTREMGIAETLPEMPAAPASSAASPSVAVGSTSSAGWTSSVGSLSAASSTAAAPSAPAVAPSGSFDSLVGATLANRYTIVRRIGEGGMGAVYEARHAVIGKRVAVKVLLEKFLSKSDFVARLLQEARLASAIGHENIVDVVDFGTTDDGRSFVVMEFLDGESLAQLLMREAPLPVERSLRLARQVASALSAAHAKGIVHRDVKPENVYIVRRGDADFVKVVDFGISKAVRQGQGEQGDDPPESLRLTHTGLLLGTPLYMSPEQARGAEDLDHRVDIWALGVMLYECLTGEVPFRANNYLGIISQVLNHVPVPPSQLRPELGIPEAVEAVVMHAMEKDRARRAATMADLERDLERLLAGDQNVGMSTLDAAAVEVSSRPSVHRWHLGLAAGLALIGGAVLVVTRPGAGPEGVPRPAVVGPASPTSSTSAGSPGAAAARAAASGAPAENAPATPPGDAPVAPLAKGTAPGAGAGEAPAGTTEAALAGRPASTHPSPPKRKRAPARVARRADAAAANTAAPAKPAGIPQSIMRGVLSTHSPEGYPDSR